MISIIISSIFSSIILLSYGVIIDKFIFNKNTKDIDPWICGLYGFIITGFIIVVLNFFFPIDKKFGTLFFILSLIIFLFYFCKIEKKKS